MTDRLEKLSPRNAGFSGGRISIDGDTIWVYAKTIVARFNQGVRRVDPVDGPLLFFADRDVVGTIEVSHLNETAGGHLQFFLYACGRINGIEGVTVALDSGVTYTGTLVPLGKVDTANVDDKDRQIPGKLTFHFSGTISGDGGSSGIDVGSSGTVYTDLKSVEGAGEMVYTRDYIDQRGSRATEPFVIVGIREDSGVPLELAVNRAVQAMGGPTHTWRGDATLPFARVVGAHFIGVGMIAGLFVYDHHAADCNAYQYHWDVGYAVRGQVLDIVTGDSGSDPQDVCNQVLADQTILRIHDNIQPFIIHLVPCVWTTDPQANPSLMAMVGRINDAPITINGISRPAYEVRFDGVEGGHEITGPSGTKYVGYMKLSQMIGGWIDLYLFCTRIVPLPLEGDQTLPSYTSVSGTKNLYEHDRETFSSIESLCPECYGV